MARHKQCDKKAKVSAAIILSVWAVFTLAWSLMCWFECN